MIFCLYVPLLGILCGNFIYIISFDPHNKQLKQTEEVLLYLFFVVFLITIHKC